MVNQQLIEIGNDLLENNVSIDEWWRVNEEFLKEIRGVDTGKEVMIWVGGYFRYGMYQFNNGYTSQALVNVSKSIEILDANKGKLYEHEYKGTLETLIERKVEILGRLERYWEAYKLMKSLHDMCPGKDDYRIGMNNLLGASINKIAVPLYVVFACIWGVMLFEGYVTHTHFIPRIVWDITWIGWIVLLVVTYVVPWIMSKLTK